MSSGSKQSTQHHSISHSCPPRTHTVSSKSHSHAMSEAPLMKAATRAHQLDLKHTIMPPEMDTLDLATNHFYYLLLKDPFATKEQHCALAVEAFGCTFAEKPELEFEISQDMISFMSTASGFFGSY